VTFAPTDCAAYSGDANTGDVALALLGMKTVGNFIVASTCGSRVEPGASCTASVTFAPTARGDRAGALLVETDTAQAVAPVSLAGKAVGRR